MTTTSVNILIADDDLEDLELIVESFSELDPAATINTVANGKAAIEYLDSLLHASLPCLIILDYNMPEMNGLQVLSKICNQERYRNIPKVILSTSNAAIHIKECKDHGADEYFVKPDTKKQLDLIAKKCLALCSGS